MTMTLLAVIAIAVACGLAVVAWSQYREAQQRSAARVAALTTAIDGPILEAGLETRSHWQEPFPEAGLHTRGHELDAFGAEQSAFGAAWQTPATMPARRGWIIAAGAVPVALIIAALLVTRGPRPAEAPLTARQPDSLELLAMHSDRAGDLLTVTGTVRVRGRDTAPVTAVFTGRDAAGRIVANAHAPLDDAALDLGGESSFQVSVSGGEDVRRYQVRFETPLGPLPHIDRRPATP
jgi:hypothetical protein